MRTTLVVMIAGVAVTGSLPALGSFTPRSCGHWGLTNVYVVFNDTVETSSGQATNNYTINPGNIHPFSAQRIYSNIVALSVVPLTADTEYVLTVENVRNNASQVQDPNPTSLHSFVTHTWDSEADYILACQIGDGAIADTTNSSAGIVPYFSLMACLGLLSGYENGASNTDYLCATTNCLRWYANHMETGECWVVYDHFRDGDTSVRTNTYDSSDSYAALFCWTTWKCYDITRDADFLSDFYDWSRRAYAAITNTMEPDNLTFGKPGCASKYFMDNTEVLLGFVGLYRLAAAKGEDADALEYYSRAKRTLQALDTFWNAAGGGWDPSLHRFATAKGIASYDYSGGMYPGSMAQMMGIINFLDGAGPRAQSAQTRAVETFMPNYVLPSSNRCWDASVMQWEQMAALKTGDMRKFFSCVAEYDYMYYPRAGFDDNTNAIGRRQFISGNYIRTCFMDTNAPGKISLSASTGAGQGVVDLQWTAPGDDGYAPGRKACGYVVKYARTPIHTEDEWRNASFVWDACEPVPATAGTMQAMSVTGLPVNRTNYFAMRAYDEQLNWSDVSTPVSAAGTGVLVSTELPVDDFEADDTTNCFGGLNTLAYLGTATITVTRASGNPSFVHRPEGSGSGAQKIVYSGCSGGSYALYSMDFNGEQDLSLQKYLTLWVRKQGAGNPACRVQIASAGGTNTHVLNDYLPSGQVLDYWQQAYLPLDAYDDTLVQLDRSRMLRVDVVFDGVWDSPSGTVYLDDVCFNSISNPPVIWVNTMEYRTQCLDPNAMNGGIYTGSMVSNPGSFFSNQYSSAAARHGASSFNCSLEIAGTEYAYAMHGLGWPTTNLPQKPLHPVNVTGCDKMVFWVKGSGAGQSVGLNFQESIQGGPGWNERRTVSGIDTSWQKMEMALSSFWYCPKNALGFVKFSWDSETSAAGDFYFDDACFVSDDYDIWAPGPVSNLSGSSGNGKAHLSWAAPTVNGDIDLSPVLDLAGYDIWRSSTSGTSYAKIGFTVNTNFSDSTVTTSNTYYYVILSRDAAGNIGIAQEETQVDVTGVFQPYTFHETPHAWLDYWGLVSGNDYEGADLTDTDGDGVPAWAEYRAGTRPGDPDSAFKITSITADGSISWLGGTNEDNVPFAVFYRTSMVDESSWVWLTNVSRNSTGTNSVSGPELLGGDAIRFLRIMAPTNPL